MVSQAPNRELEAKLAIDSFGTDRWPITTTGSLPVALLLLPSSTLEASEVMDMRRMHSDCPRGRTEKDAKCAASHMYRGEKCRWWCLPLVSDRAAHRRMESHVLSLLQQQVPHHPRAELVMAH